MSDYEMKCVIGSLEGSDIPSERMLAELWLQQQEIKRMVSNLIKSTSPNADISTASHWDLPGPP